MWAQFKAIEPPKPEALRLLPGDETIVWTVTEQTRDSGWHWFFPNYEIERMKLAAPGTREAELASAWEAWEAWEADCDAVMTSVGYDKSAVMKIEREREKEIEPLQDERREIIATILETPAMTLAGMEVKLRVGLPDSEGCDAREDWLASLLDDVRGMVAA